MHCVCERKTEVNEDIGRDEPVPDGGSIGIVVAGEVSKSTLEQKRLAEVERTEADSGYDDGGEGPPVVSKSKLEQCIGLVLVFIWSIREHHVHAC